MAYPWEQVRRLQIQNGQITTGEVVMHHFIEAVDRGETPTREDLAFLSDAFKKIFLGVDPKKALAIERSRGRKEPMSVKDALPYVAIALAVITKMDSGLGYGKAIQEVAQERHLSFKTVQRRHSEHKESAKVYWDFLESIKKVPRKLSKGKSKDEK